MSRWSNLVPIESQHHVCAANRYEDDLVRGSDHIAGIRVAPVGFVENDRAARGFSESFRRWGRIPGESVREDPSLSDLRGGEIKFRPLMDDEPEIFSQPDSPSVLDFKPPQQFRRPLPKLHVGRGWEVPGTFTGRLQLLWP